MDEFIEIPANKNSLSKRRPVYSIGINDADYLKCGQLVISREMKLRGKV
jgi:hypothetical protein